MIAFFVYGSVFTIILSLDLQCSLWGSNPRLFRLKVFFYAM